LENKPDNVLTIEELSVNLEISKSTLYKLVRGVGKSLLKR
jgi:predicted transcriptional regulator